MLHLIYYRVCPGTRSTGKPPGSWHSGTAPAVPTDVSELLRLLSPVEPGGQTNREVLNKKPQIQSEHSCSCSNNNLFFVTFLFFNIFKFFFLQYVHLAHHFIFINGILFIYISCCCRKNSCSCSNNNLFLVTFLFFNFPLNRHIVKGHSKETSYKCYRCGMMFILYSPMNRHIFQRHKKEANYKCTGFMLDFPLNRHIVQRHRKKPSNKCTGCEMKFILDLPMNRHIVSRHSKEKSYKCTGCGVKFRLDFPMNRHLV